MQEIVVINSIALVHNFRKGLSWTDAAPSPRKGSSSSFKDSSFETLLKILIAMKINVRAINVAANSRNI